MHLVIVTGMSGAGKTTALKILEDNGFYCVDNLPIPLLEKFTELVTGNHGDIKNAALGIDIRSGEELSECRQVFQKWSQLGLPVQILFLDSSDQVLIKRYKESRRSHPLAGMDRLDKGIEREREKLSFLKEKADFIIDTSQLLTRELRGELGKIFLENHKYHNMFVTLLSFGFKYGIPSDADLVFDVRFLPNPYYQETLKYKTGEKKEVSDFVMQGETGALFLEKLNDLLLFLLPQYIQEGKNQMVIAVGCTGGKHRSVTIANELYKSLSQQKDMGIRVEHRDIDKDNKGKS